MYSESPGAAAQEAQVNLDVGILSKDAIAADTLRSQNSFDGSGLGRTH
jgi:hypothetical protein